VAIGVNVADRDLVFCEGTSLVSEQQINIGQVFKS